MRVLVVEDEPGIAAFIQRGLEENAYAVDVSGDGGEAYHWVKNFDYDIIILDVMLPGMDGIELCRRLRADGIQTPVLMLTARDAIDDRVTGLDAGADDYLVKPFAFRELLARLRALGRRGSGEPANQIKVGDLMLDRVGHRVERGGKQIDLSAREFALLEMLMQHPGQTLSRTLIAEHVWDYDFSHQSNVVDVYIRYLRQKIDDPFAEKLIETVRGIGYRLRRPESVSDENR